MSDESITHTLKAIISDMSNNLPTQCHSIGLIEKNTKTKQKYSNTANPNINGSIFFISQS
jgi:hypothetical protein